MIVLLKINPKELLLNFKIDDFFDNPLIDNFFIFLFILILFIISMLVSLTKRVNESIDSFLKLWTISFSLFIVIKFDLT